MRHPEASKTVAQTHLSQGERFGGEHFAEDILLLPAVCQHLLHQGVHYQGIAVLLLRRKTLYPVVGVTGASAVELIGKHDCVVGKFGMVREIRRGKKTSTVLHPVERIGIVSTIDPGADKTMGMIQTQTIKFDKHLAQTFCNHLQHRAGVSACIQVLGRIQHLITPRLPLKRGATGWRSQIIVAQQQALQTPGVTQGETHLQIAVELQSQSLHAVTESTVLPQ